MGLHIIIAGNPVDGFSYYGPFATALEAAEALERDLDRGLICDGWIAPLEAWEQ